MSSDTCQPLLQRARACVDPPGQAVNQDRNPSSAKIMDEGVSLPRCPFHVGLGGSGWLVGSLPPGREVKRIIAEETLKQD